MQREVAEEFSSWIKVCVCVCARGKEKKKEKRKTILMKSYLFDD